MEKARQIDLKEHQQIMFEILCDFADFCDEHGLNYYLDAGTLLGAVRHQGFIPWDNDVDVCMMRPDYDRFIKLVQESNGYITKNLFIEFPEDSIYPFIKVCDIRTTLIEFPERYPIKTYIYIDVFCKDGIREKSFKSMLMCKISEFLGLVYWFNKFSIFAWEKNGNFIQKLISRLGRRLIKDSTRPIRWQNWLLDRNKRNNLFNKCMFVTTLTNGEYHKIAPRECFSDYILLPFNNVLLKCPKGYDTYLKCLYPGNYMIVPPEGARVSHNIEVYWNK